MKPDVNHLPFRLIFVRRRTRTGILRAPAAGAQVWIARSGAAPNIQNRGSVKNTIKAPSLSLDLPHSFQGAAPDGAFLRSLSRPNLATGWFHPATPLPDAEVSFLTGEVIHQAGMEQRSGFEPPLPAWRAGVLTVEHLRCVGEYRAISRFRGAAEASFSYGAG